MNDAAESDAATDSGMLFQSAIVRGTKEDLNSVVLVRRVSNFFLLVSAPQDGHMYSPVFKVHIYALKRTSSPLLHTTKLYKKAICGWHLDIYIYDVSATVGACCLSSSKEEDDMNMWCMVINWFDPNSPFASGNN